MYINLIRFDRNGDGTTYNRTPVRWDTDKELDASSASRYGGGYEFVGTDTLEGGLSLTLRFSTVQDADTFMVIAQEAYAQANLTPSQVERWGRFMDSLATLVANAPNPARMYDPPQPIAWDGPQSYHAGIDAVRGRGDGA